MEEAVLGLAAVPHVQVQGGAGQGDGEQGGRELVGRGHLDRRGGVSWGASLEGAWSSGSTLRVQVTGRCWQSPDTTVTCLVWALWPCTVVALWPCTR